MHGFDKMNAAQRISAVRRLLVRNHLWWGAIALRLDVIEAKWVPTAGVDDRHLFYNPDFIMTLSFKELEGVVAHEILHVTNKHSTRRGMREHDKWNRACDYAINPILLKEGFSLPSFVLNDKQYHGMSAEQIYPLLPDSPGGGGDNSDPGRCGGVLSPRNPDGTPRNLGPYEKMQAERQIDGHIAAATSMAKQMGVHPGAFVDGLPPPSEPKVDWREVLNRWCHANGGVPHDTTWSRPNRRYIGRDIYLPATTHNNDLEMAIVFDTSGSIGPKEFSIFLGELNSIRDVIRPKLTHFLQCDAAIHDYQCLKPGESIKAEIKGRGGTSFRPPFEYLDHHKIEPNCLVYFTDMFGDFPPPSKFPVLWASTTKGLTAPFGETIFVEL